MSAESNHSTRSVLEQLAAGQITVEQTLKSLTTASNVGFETSSQGDLRIDSDRAIRCGYPEVIYAPGKTNDALLAGINSLRSHSQNILITRCSIQQQSFLAEQSCDLIINGTANTARWNSPEQAQNRVKGRVVVVSAGTSDRPVAEEAVETLKWMDVETELLMDVGVAGPQRFLKEKYRLFGADSIVVVAGMEGALPSVVAGWVDCPVIAVPTSVGYGTAFGGLTALLGMLNSCAANVAVVNIDAGFKAGYLAGMIARGKHNHEDAS